uniref:Uncharacterized protein n=1 Tax=Rhizophagus irregularis (strain DAOM 181602 / DAOM 197198 / MUCL 43194) TaxID=747089 RepID=U9TKD1_RHIID
MQAFRALHGEYFVQDETLVVDSFESMRNDRWIASWLACFDMYEKDANGILPFQEAENLFCVTEYKDQQYKTTREFIRNEQEKNENGLTVTSASDWYFSE